MQFGRKIIIGAFFMILFLVTGGTSAREIIQGDQCIIDDEETLSGDVFIICRTLIINGHIDGNLFGAAMDAEIGENGHVRGDVYLLAGQLDIHGTIDNNLHFAGAVLRVHSTARFTSQRSDLISMSLSTMILDQAVIPGSVVDLSYQLVTQGSIGHEINFWGSALIVGGKVDGDVFATVGDPQSSGAARLETLFFPFEADLIESGLIVTERAHVNGDVNYWGPVEGRIDGVVTGKVIYTPVTPSIVGASQMSLGEEQDAGRSIGLYVDQVIREFMTLVVIGMIALLIAPRLLQAPIPDLQARPLSSLGVGMLGFILSFPIVLIVLLLSLITLLVIHFFGLSGVLIAVGMVLGVVNIGGASLFYFVAIYIARIIVCLVIGRIVVRYAVGDDGSTRIVYISLVFGVVLLALLSSLPIIGWIFNALALFIGLGGILTVLHNRLQRLRLPTAYTARFPVTTPMLPSRPEEARQIPPPVIDDRQTPPGMDNLPGGFKWWDD